MSAPLKGDTSWLRDAFVAVQEELSLKIRRAAQSIAHAPTQGSVNEDHWIEVFRAYLPDRYKCDTGFVIDSAGGQSDQIDIIIYDRHFTPTLLDQQRHRYIPAEAVYAVFESKPHFDKNYLEYAGQKAASVRKLKRTSVPITHVEGVSQPRPLFPLVAGLVAPRSSWADGLGANFEKNLPTDPNELLDCGCALEHGMFDTFDGNLQVFPSEGALIRFLFRVLSKLQSLGSVPAVNWAAYASVVSSKP